MEKQLMFAALVAMFLVASVTAQSLYGDGSLDVGLDGKVNTTVNSNTNSNVNVGTEMGFGASTTVTLKTDNTISVENGNSEMLVTLGDSDLRAEVNNNGLVIINAKGETTAVVLTPQEAVVRAEAETGGSCADKCEIEIDEESENGEEIIVYEVTVEQQTQVFGYWDAEMEVEATVNAQTGQIVDVNRPWWAFLATETQVGN